jgi:hypothetical protein
MPTLTFGHYEDRTPTHGYEATREDAMAAFAKSWRPSSGQLAVTKLAAVVALVFCFVAGYFVVDLWSRRDTSPLAQICARVDYVNGLQENLKDAAREATRSC